MSKNLNERNLRWKDLEVQLRGTASCHLSLSEIDKQTYVSAIILHGMILDDILSSNGSSLNWGAMKRWALFCASTPPPQLGRSLKVLSVFFRNYKETDKMTYSAFKQQMTEDFNMGIFLSPIKSFVESFLAGPNAGDFDVLNQHLSFLSRLNLPSINYLEESLTDWRETETRLGSLELDKELISSLNKIIIKWFEDWTPPLDHLYKHGPGGVAEEEAKTIGEKYRCLRTDIRLDYCLKSELEPGLLRHNRVVFVPKSLTTWRTISMEPASLQWFQQGIWGSMSQFLRDHKELSKHLKISNQEQNRRLALQGSLRPHTLGTVDLSAASDSVSWELVKGIFAHTRLMRYLLASRSTSSLLPNGEVVDIKKFAPMGSAICFPMESIIFCAVCKYVEQQTGIRGFYSVYGDDIIVPISWAPKLYQVLTDLGFKVNETKSFIDPLIFFRESCGMDAWGGSDVTPVRIPRNYVYLRGKRLWKSPSVYQCYVDLCNRLHDKGFRLARIYILEALLSLPPKFRPIFSADGLKGIKSVEPTNHHLVEVYDQNYQHSFVEHSQIDVTKSSPGDDWVDYEYIRYYECLRNQVDRKVDVLAYLGETPTTFIGAARPKLGRTRSHASGK